VRKLSNDARKKNKKYKKKREPAVPGRAATGGVAGVAAWAAPLGFGHARGCRGSAAQRRVLEVGPRRKSEPERAERQFRGTGHGRGYRRRWWERWSAS